MKKRQFLHFGIVVLTVLGLANCDNTNTPISPTGLTMVNIAAIQGLIIPETGGTPVRAINESSQYSGTVTWNGNPSTFAALTVYTATITLTPKTGYTLQGVAANFFTVEGAAEVRNSANSGIITAVFPMTGIISSVNLIITAPVKGATPGTTASDSEKGDNFTIGTVSWSPTDNPFAGNKVYTATVTLTAKSGYTFTGLSSQTINGQSVVVSNHTDSTVTLSHTFPVTDTKTVTKIAIKTQPSKLSYIHGDKLDLTGLVVTLTHDDSTTEDVAASGFAGKNITANPAAGNNVDYSAHNGQPIKINYGSLTCNTTNLTVEPPPTPGLAYKKINNNTAWEVSKGTANAAEVVIPSLYEGLPVTAIGDKGFQSYKNMTSVTIPNSVTSIGWDAFYNCSGLTSVTIPNSVTSIGSEAFRDCTSLTSVTIPNRVTSVDRYTFYNCASLTSVTIPNSVTSIGDGAFRSCASLTSVTIPNSVTSIGKDAFDGCTSLTSVTIPNSVTSIGNHAFDGCTSLTSVTIPNSVTSIEQGVFRGCTRLTSVTIPNSVTSIDRSAFYGCTSLTSVTIPSSVTSIGWEVFFNSSLTSVTIPGSVTSIGEAAFATRSLTSINVDSSNTYYCSEQGILYNKNKTTLVAYPPGKTGSSFIIPESVTSIFTAAFYNCSGLTSITIPNSVTSIGGSAFKDCTGLTSVTIPNSVTSIGDGAFRGTSLTSVTIPNSVTSIGCFSGCTSLTSITIPNSVTSIGGSAFKDCTGLTSITIPNSVTSIGKDAFHGCTGLTSVTFQGTIARYADDWGFDGNLKSIFYETDWNNGTPGTYTRASGNLTWKKI